MPPYNSARIDAVFAKNEVKRMIESVQNSLNQVRYMQRDLDIMRQHLDQIETGIERCLQELEKTVDQRKSHHETARRGGTR